MKNLFLSTLVGLLAVVCSAQATAADAPVVRTAIQPRAGLLDAKEMRQPRVVAVHCLAAVLHDRLATASGLALVDPQRFVAIRDGDPSAIELATGVWLVSASARLDAPLERLVLGVMNGGTGGPGFTGALAEVLVYKGAPTPSRLALIEQSLRPKYGK